ncbi:glycosyltransferase family 1 protein [Latilactobacillus curvatus]|uniref:glycosyltransferase n=1 Tax=Latilactobacillus TaxID=2767885 RepID=UPI001CBC9DCB|nr:MULTISPECIES: glycosyltransferase [Latilactobacillus]MBZ1505383.1 glycosyltransferase [Latilactobacillus curvatus]MCP8850850.1 glycosyltransferase [Latilactobacillus sakei]MCT3529536.1 glycosyltransferase family 1 protein [Latilactobacillus curvatus]UTC10996.1 hypothetical protein A4W79_07160 [Latilactobacillus curvatus]
MKILVINTVEFTLNGMSSAIMNYYENMSHANLKTDFIVNKKISVEYKEIIRKNKDSITVLNRRSVFEYYSKLKKILENGSYDVIHIHGNSTTTSLELFIARNIRKNSNTKIIVHGHGVQTSHPILHRVLRPFFKRNYDYGFAASKEAGSFLFGNADYKIINNGISINRFRYNEIKRNTIRNKLKISPTTKLILHVGLFSQIKNQGFIVDMAKNMALKDCNIKFLLIGKGPEKEQVKKDILANKLEDMFILVSPQSDIEDYYSAADLFLFPSLYESFGIAVLEAECSGLPCLVSDRVPKEIDQTGLVTFFSLNNMKDCIKNIGSIKNNKNRLLQSRTLNNSEYDINRIANDLREFYMDCKV